MQHEINTFKFLSLKLNQILNTWSVDNLVFVPSDKGLLIRYNEGMKIYWDEVPVWTGVKEFVFPGRNMVLGNEDFPKEKPIILVGVRNCDLRALINVYDNIFLKEEPADLNYKKLRERLLLVTVDCNNPAESCFCVSTGGRPYTENGSDVNLSFVEEYVTADVFTEKGKELFSDFDLKRASEKELQKREDRRTTVTSKISKNYELKYDKDDLGKLVESNNDENYWMEKSTTCMQCGGCNFCCPTCYCNVLNEVSRKKTIRKVLQWDSCQFPGYARVAGGANPRVKLWQRFKNRYYCKFTLMPGEFGICGCTGCGRCIQTCPGEIDIRDTLRGLKDEKTG